MLHSTNVAIHVLAGTLALLLGFVQVAASKGRGAHVTRGRGFLVCTWIVVATATLGLVAFRFVAFLAVITLLVAYWTYSGLRALRIRDTGPTLQDGLASVVGLAAVVGFVVFIQHASFPWVPAVIYSTLGTLATVCVYDLARFAFPREWFQTLWLREHIVKMLGAHGALAAAFFGTVLSAFQPFSQIAPSVIWTLAMVMIAAYHSPRRRAALALGILTLSAMPLAARQPANRREAFVGRWETQESIAGDEHTQTRNTPISGGLPAAARTSACRSRSGSS